MSDFRQLSDSVWASPQIGLDDVAEAARLGFALIINNRPEGESPDQVPGEAIAAAARAHGMAYCAIPVTHAGFSLEQVEELGKALAAAKGPALAYCRSGTRSTFLWALAQAKAGQDPAAIANAAAQAGYDVSPLSGMLQQLAATAKG
ncbi:TIGR01244 family sulfur transferase [Altererythrobacter lauratis]|uniref:TIGR01244 family sulfur transferase n=1 Tax=Alteraurantiacibacter lauratis TaxID=2054627 RepID=A0ABV7EFU9_9SPHN